jgi:hypothetical protein
MENPWEATTLGGGAVLEAVITGVAALFLVATSGAAGHFRRPP